ncbi:hypothetical protein LR48_Vigan641s009300 [Vigna angularis]|uniref:Uncharacterized protein n=1 Tax=Phaseolus angularis TaxID=3914 RepID=A0A0L9TFB3_PHAAN|nr:hypothetical protein LR48_Vigan641s009300 [Vigna angularis]
MVVLQCLFSDTSLRQGTSARATACSEANLKTSNHYRLPTLTEFLFIKEVCCKRHTPS